MDFTLTKMTYKCPKCGATAEQAGNCPTCNVPMVESEGGSPEAPQQPAESNPNQA